MNLANPTEASTTGAAPRRVGVLLINLGTPEAPTPRAVRTYLKEFLSDPRVVEIPRIVWWPILHLVILTTRPTASAARYEQIWTPEGSPLRVYTERQANLLRGYLGERFRNLPLEVDYAMRYGEPSIAEQLDGLKARGCTRILLFPLYPQYSASTTATAFDAAFSALSHRREQPEIRTIRDFHDDTGYIEALADNVRDYWRRGRPDVLVMSFHGVPRRTVDLGDPYYAQCMASGRRLAAALGLAETQYRITFQSRFGRAEWLQPYTTEVLTQLGRASTGTVDVVCPGFVADCLETLEEIAIEGKGLFLKAGGRELRYIPCLNDRHEWIRALRDLTERNLLGWIAAPPSEPENRTFRGLSSGMGA